MATISYPLLFGYNEILIGPEYAIRVSFDGRALVHQEDDGWWIDGVNPGAVAGGGKTFLEAFNDFRRNIKAVCIDIVSDCNDFGDIKRSIEHFFRECDAETLAEWSAARESVRTGRVAIDGLGTVSDVREPCVRVTRATGPADNSIDPEPAIAA